MTYSVAWFSGPMVVPPASGEAMTKSRVYDDITVYRSTYRYLRWAMVAALVALFVSVLIQSSLAGCWLGSVSAYYYTPARAVFVGSLIAFGAALIAYKGRTPEEDVALDLSGFLAIVVAIVPTVPDDLCAAAGFALSSDEIAAAVVNNVWSLVITSVVAAVVLAVRWLVTRRRAAELAPAGSGSDGRVRASRIRAGIMAVAGLALLVGELWYFLTRPETFIEVSHGIAAITMVFGLVLVMALNAALVEHTRRFRVTYYALAGLLVALVAGVLVAHTQRWILILELVVFAVFVAYWILQSIELWDGAAGHQQSEPTTAGRGPTAGPPLAPGVAGGSSAVPEPAEHLHEPVLGALLVHPEPAEHAGTVLELQ
jgi:hypothetical protein